MSILTPLIRAFRDYWSPKAIALRMDTWTQGFRASTGQNPDPKVDQRIKDRSSDNIR
jgi:hypothetical protein